MEDPMLLHALSRRALLPVVAAVALVAVPSPAQAAPAGLYQVVNRQTDECLGVWNASRAHAADVEVAACNDASHRLWRPHPAGVFDGRQYYFLIVQHTGMCLNVVDYGQADGIRVVQAACSYTSNEQWRFDPVPDTENFWIVARHSQKCLDKAWGGSVVQWRCWRGNEWWQQWRLGYVRG
jgi:hypothetical protein